MWPSPSMPKEMTSWPSVMVLAVKVGCLNTSHCEEPTVRRPIQRVLLNGAVALYWWRPYQVMNCWSPKVWREERTKATELMAEAPA